MSHLGNGGAYSTSTTVQLESHPFIDPESMDSVINNNKIKINTEICIYPVSDIFNLLI